MTIALLKASRTVGAVKIEMSRKEIWLSSRQAVRLELELTKTLIEKAGSLSNELK